MPQIGKLAVAGVPRAHEGSASGCRAASEGTGIPPAAGDGDVHRLMIFQNRI
jgi:hypothetical protein